MKTNQKLALTLLAGVLVGLIAAQAIPAQAVKLPPAYVIAEVEPDPTKPADPAASKRYAEEAPKAMAAFGGQYLIRGGKAQTVEGETSKGRIVVIAFESLEKARGWYFSPAYEAVKPIRQNSTKSRILIVEGVSP
jgi:uncharacterized protein (DUF1330 family)